MSLAVYVHIPYCLQRCTYCDFATYEKSKIMPPADYLSLLFEEMNQTENSHPKGILQTIYFGGGTPSLLPAEDIVSIIQRLANLGFSAGPQTEITIEINPATISPEKMELYLKAGINRFSVGAQTFNDPLLKSVHREHNAQQTRDTLNLLKYFGVQYSFDILFALPGQTLDILKADLQEVLHFDPDHVSPYCLTVPEGHVLSKGRPLEEHQLEMFEMIRRTLEGAGYERYEISNFSKPNRRSKHNSMYWDESPYWGLGLSAHSYSPMDPWGIRYWNPNSIGSYQNLIQSQLGQKFRQPGDHVRDDHKEVLQKHQALTDHCHIRLRTKEGLDLDLLKQRFGPPCKGKVLSQLQLLSDQGFVTNYDKPGNKWKLTEEGVLLSNQVFSALTYLKGELD